LKGAPDITSGLPRACLRLEAQVDNGLDELQTVERAHADRDESTSVHGLASGWL
jgi:hypothetical protein